jgi:methionyl-tRNA formyltransferase
MRILFAGTSAIGEQTLRMLLAEHDVVGLLTQPDRPAGRHRRLTPPPIKTLFQELAPETPLFQPETLRDAVLQEALQALKPEVMVTFSYGKIIPPPLLALPSVASLNVHASLLPRYRGASPIQAAVMNGDEETGITIMYMAEGLDTGDILLSKKIRLDPRETAGTLTERLALMAPAALREALLQLGKGKALRFPQDEKLVTHTHLIERAHAALDWNRPASHLEWLIRAMNPKPGAHAVVTLPSGKKVSLKIFAARVVVTPNVLGQATLQKKEPLGKREPGSFFVLENLTGLPQLPLLACGHDALLLEEIQPEGGSRMSFEAFVHGHLGRG